MKTRLPKPANVARHAASSANIPLNFTRAKRLQFLGKGRFTETLTMEHIPPDRLVSVSEFAVGQSSISLARKLIAFDEDTFHKLTQLGRDRMATIQELADEAFADVLKKHGIPIDLKDALRKSAGPANSDGPKKSMARGEAKAPGKATLRKATSSAKRKTRS